MEGGAISHNTGAGVLMTRIDSSDKSTFNLSGEVDISGNIDNSGSYNVKLGANKNDVISVKGRLENTKPIGVTAEITENELKSLLSHIHPKPVYHLLQDKIDGRFYIILAVEPDNDTDDYTAVTAYINGEFAQVMAEEGRTITGTKFKNVTENVPENVIEASVLCRMTWLTLLAENIRCSSMWV